MHKCVATFEKVSFEEFLSSFKEIYDSFTDNEIREIYDHIELPVRATKGSAGYDFMSPYTFTLESGETEKIPTGIRVRIDEGWWLGILPRSGLGFKYRAQLDNSVGVIDSDYYNSDNQGHIFIKITNDSKTAKNMTVRGGEGVAQGIFLPFGLTYDDAAEGVRNGGFGSTTNCNIVEFAQEVKQPA